MQGTDDSWTSGLLSLQQHPVAGLELRQRWNLENGPIVRCSEHGEDRLVLAVEQVIGSQTRHPKSSDRA